jgi:hypothetical protein
MGRPFFARAQAAMVGQIFVEIVFGVTHGSTDFDEPGAFARKAHPLHRSDGKRFSAAEIFGGRMFIEQFHCCAPLRCRTGAYYWRLFRLNMNQVLMGDIFVSPYLTTCHVGTVLARHRNLARPYS